MHRFVALDIDGVLADIVPGMLTELGEPARWDVHNAEASYSHLSKEEIVAVFSDPAFVLAMVPMAGVLEAAWELAEAGYEFHYLTCRPREVAHATIEWLKGHGFPGGKIFHMLNGPEKAWMVIRGNYEFLVEDHPVTAAEVAEHGKLAFIVQDWRWPYAMQGYGDAIPVSSLAEAVEWLKEVGGA